MPTCEARGGTPATPLHTVMGVSNSWRRRGYERTLPSRKISGKFGHNAHANSFWRRGISHVYLEIGNLLLVIVCQLGHHIGYMYIRHVYLVVCVYCSSHCGSLDSDFDGSAMQWMWVVTGKSRSECGWVAGGIREVTLLLQLVGTLDVVIHGPDVLNTHRLRELPADQSSSRGTGMMRVQAVQQTQV